MHPVEQSPYKLDTWCADWIWAASVRRDQASQEGDLGQRIACRILGRPEQDSGGPDALARFQAAHQWAEKHWRSLDVDGVGVFDAEGNGALTANAVIALHAVFAQPEADGVGECSPEDFVGLVRYLGRNAAESGE